MRKKVSPRHVRAIIVAIAAVIAIVCCVEIPKAIQYRHAVELMNQGDFEAAAEQFDSLGKYRWASGYYDYCTARNYAGNDDYGWASIYYWRLKHTDAIPKSKQPDGYADFINAMAEREKAFREAEKVAQAREYRDKLRTGVPFVGMRESDIDRTTLRKHNVTPFRNHGLEDGKMVEGTVYEWAKDGYVIFSARCTYGTVRQVWDYRDTPWKRVKGTASPSMVKGPEATPTPEIDRLDAKSYDNPEDFYDDNYYDFFDYEEAEDYYYAHGGR